MMKEILLVSDMHCSNCTMKIESLEDELPGIRRISASYRKGEMVVEFDENKVDLDTIIAAVKKQGYTAKRP
jgi:copper chaperone CopZ